jgi:hypothetical protein
MIWNSRRVGQLGSAALFAILIAACQPGPGGSPTAPGSAACASFNTDADDTALGAQFSRDGFEFKSLDPSFTPQINAVSGVTGLAFGDLGLEVRLPAPASTVTLDAGAWAEPVDVAAFDGGGSLVDQLTIPNQNALSRFQLTGSGMTTLTLKEGQNEGLLVRICTGSPGTLLTPSPSPGTTGSAACAAFDTDLDDTPMSPPFTRGGFEFNSLDPSFPPRINEMAPGITGLVFGDLGLEVRLLGPASTVTLDAGAWAEPVNVAALDGAGVVVDQLTIPNQNALAQFRLTGSAIATVTFKEGANEGLLVRICIEAGD